MKEIGKRAFDMVRADPPGFSVLALEIAYQTTVTAEQGIHNRSHIGVAAGIATAGMAMVHIFQQTRLMHRLEGVIERRGYNDRIFAPTTQSWCSRQAARVVCQNAGVLEQYKALCERMSDTADLTCIPHI